MKSYNAEGYPSENLIIVSVLIIAYNVEKVISEAVESALIQITDFPFEIVIGEDASTDNTRNILRAYAEKYPDTIRLIENKENLGLTPNCVKTHNACHGKYIALLDGDDYWTDPKKLQKQIDFLEKNSDYSGCGHQSLKIFDQRNEEESLFGATYDCTYGVHDMINHRKFHTSSFVYRRELWTATGGIPENISSNERAIYPMVAIFGKIKYFKDNMCVYRNTGSGLTSRLDYVELKTDLRIIPWIKTIDPSFPTARFKTFLLQCIFTYGNYKMPYQELFKYYFLFLLSSFSYFPKNHGDLYWGTRFFGRRLFQNIKNSK